MKPRNNKTLSNINIMMIQSYTSHLLHELINTTDTPKLCDLSPEEIHPLLYADRRIKTGWSMGSAQACGKCFSWHSIDPLIPSEHHLNTVSDCVQPFMARVCLLSDAHIQQIHKQTSSDIHSSAQCLQILI